MSNKKITHYSLAKIKATGALIFLIFGKKSNGKSYAVKHENIIEEYIKKGVRFLYMRRWKDEITQGAVEQYFHDVDVVGLTGGKYNCIYCWRKKIYFGLYNDETQKVIKGDHIGYYVALSQEQNISSGSYLDVGSIIFEEFMSRTMYISGEAEKLMYLYNTIDRNRLTTKLYLVGNTINRACPYLIDWNIVDIVKKMTPDTIETTNIEDTDGNKYLMAIEYCAGNKGGAALNLGKSAANISSGDWYSEPQPKLPGSYNTYEVLYRFVVEQKGFRYLVELLTDRVNMFWFVKPKCGAVKDNTIVISDVVNVNNMYYTTITEAINNVRSDKVKRILKTFTESNIFYCSDLVGTEFKTFLKGGF